MEEPIVAMISLRRTATELDRLEELHRAALSCYTRALRSTEQNAIELDAAQAAHFRAQLHALQQQLGADTGASEWESVQVSFDSELKDYRAKTDAQVQKLRREVQAASAAVESFAGAINQSEADLEAGLKRELKSLDQVAQSDDIQVIRQAIHSSTAKISSSIQLMRASNQLAVAQLKDEIRLLHEEVQTARQSQKPDPSAESRQRITSRIEELINNDKAFSVLLVVVRNLDGLRNCYSASVIDSALRGFQSRFENILPSSSAIGRWAKDQFAAILSTAPGNAMDMSADVVRKLSQPFVEQENGATQSIAFHPQAGVIECSPGADPARFQARLKQLADTLAG
jgi:GGDEF domain-containing protein